MRVHHCLTAAFVVLQDDTYNSGEPLALDPARQALIVPENICACSLEADEEMNDLRERFRGNERRLD